MGWGVGSEVGEAAFGALVGFGSGVVVGGLGGVVARLRGSQML